MGKIGVPTFIHWFRQDLRCNDNPALGAAAARGTVLPVYILDDVDAEHRRLGAASRCWLHHSLGALDADLDGKLSVYTANPETILPELVRRHDIAGVFWNRCHEPWQVRRDARIGKLLEARGVEVCSYNGSLLWEPWEIVKQDGAPYRVFTAFFRRCSLNAPPPRKPLPDLPAISLADRPAGAKTVSELDLDDRRWGWKIPANWKIGEKAAVEKLNLFLDKGIHDYKGGRDLLAGHHVSRLSPHLHFGEISPHRVWHAVRAGGDNEHTAHFCSELGWREFSHNLLHFFPDLPERNLQSAFDAFPWVEAPDMLRCWQQGRTGIPVVDAGMRELWQTGYMHNRARMITGSFLVKNLLLDWRHGERWFRDCLVDADLANNSANWQWIAGCGADAAPYFRIFNPVLQGQRFDADGIYTRRFVPELRNLPNRFLFNPWTAPASVLENAGVRLGRDYPRPLVDLQKSRVRALEAFRALRTPEG